MNDGEILLLTAESALFAGESGCKLFLCLLNLVYTLLMLEKYVCSHAAP